MKQLTYTFRIFLSLIFLFAIQKNSEATIYTINNILNGAQEPNASPGTGTIIGTYNDVSNSLSFTVSFSGLMGNTTAAHFHAPALPGASAGVIIGYAGFPTGVTSGSYSNTYVLTAAQETNLLEGKVYANVHSNLFPGGEIRAQVFCVMTLNVLIQGFHDGSEPRTTVRDTVTANMRNASSPYSLVDSRKVYLSNTGSAVFTFSEVLNGTNYFLQILHRNSIETWSKSPGQTFASNQMTYNFTTAASQAFGNNLILNGTKFCIYGGDTNQDGVVDATDAGAIDNDAFNFVTGYVVTDLTGDEVVDATDAALADNNAFNFVSVMRP